MISKAIPLTIAASTTNYNGMPELGKKGKPILYLQLIMNGVAFGTSPPRGGLVGQAIVPGSTYTVLGLFEGTTIVYSLHPCYALAQKSAFGGSIETIGTPLQNQPFNFVQTVLLQVYPGKLARAEC
jgi:hypothetical protein